MKVYTKTGDKGKTSLIGGTRVSKYSTRIESYGTVDELNSYVGLLRDSIDDKNIVAQLLEIQDRLFTMGSSLATDPEKSRMKLPSLHASDITFLENKIDEMDATLEPMKKFILPGGHPVVSYCHIARCVCRRAERLVVGIIQEDENLDEFVLPYLNRLSDYLFELSRYMSKQLNAVETSWIARVEE